MDKKTNYQLTERDLDIPSDLEFVDRLLKEQRLEVEPQARGVILDLAYTLARDKLVEAQRFAKLSNRSNVSIADLEMANLERTEELNRRLIHQPVKSLIPSQPALPTPTVSRGLMLPTWRQCQVGIMAELKDKGAEGALPANARTGLPPNQVTASASGPVPNSGTNSMLATGYSNPGRNTLNPIARPAGSNMNPPDNFSKTAFITTSSRSDQHNLMRNHAAPRMYVNRSTAGYVSDSSICFGSGFPGGVQPGVKKPRMQQ